MSLSACPAGRVYAFNAALKAAELRTSKSDENWKATSCRFAEHWHVVSTSPVVKLDPFPPTVAAQLDRRDEHCQRCGRGGRLERHHRRAKHMGGSKGRAHTQCACNGLRLCRTCHRWVHENVTEATDHGWIVKQAVVLPAKAGVTRCIGVAMEDWAPVPVLDPQWLRCDGTAVHSPLEVED